MKNKTFNIILLLAFVIISVIFLSILGSTEINPIEYEKTSEQIVKEVTTEENKYNDYLFILGDKEKEFTARIKQSKTNRILVTYYITENEWIDVTENGCLFWYKGETVNIYKDNWCIEGKE